jgi:two-component system nitrogen regulation sensor histidine kinase GlnL
LSVQAGPLGREHRVIDVTMTPLDSEFERKYLLLEIADATQRQRITRENELISRLDSSRRWFGSCTRDQESARRTARRGTAARAGAARAPARIHGIIISEADRLTALVDSMIGPARAPQKALINVHELCEHVYRLLRSEARGGVLVERDYDPSLPKRSGRCEPDHPGAAQHRAQCVAGDRRAARIVIRTRVAANVNIGTTRHKLAASLQVEDNGPVCRPRSPTPFSSRWSPGAPTARAGPRGFAGPRDAPRRPHRI